MKSIVVAGSLAQRPGRGGHTWVFLQYLLGFRKLGWDVLFLDRLDPGMCVDEHGHQVSPERSWNLAYMHEVMCRFGLGRHYSVLVDGGSSAIGVSREAVQQQIASAAAVINVMGFLDDEELLAASPMRVCLDIDPGFGQMWRALELHDAFAGHDAYVTIAPNIGRPSCAIPTCGLEWVTTLQPVVLDEWPACDGDTGSRPLTSIVSWRGAYGPIAYNGRTYGLRAHEFRRFAALPQAAGDRFELALDIHEGDARDIDLLRRHGWDLASPSEAAGDPWRYRDYIQRSAGELMVAKNMYVDTQSGWVSDRSICYLASGRPVVAQDTGVATVLPVGEGLLTFRTIEEAAEAVHRIRREPRRHQQAARRLAEEHFESSRVLGALVRALDLD